MRPSRVDSARDHPTVVVIDFRITATSFRGDAAVDRVFPRRRIEARQSMCRSELRCRRRATSIMSTIVLAVAIFSQCDASRAVAKSFRSSTATLGAETAPTGHHDPSESEFSTWMETCSN